MDDITRPRSSSQSTDSHHHQQNNSDTATVQQANGQFSERPLNRPTCVGSANVLKIAPFLLPFACRPFFGNLVQRARYPTAKAVYYVHTVIVEGDG